VQFLYFIECKAGQSVEFVFLMNFNNKMSKKMTGNFKKLINILLSCCFLSMISWGQDAFSPDELIVYPQSKEKGTAKSQLLQILNEAQRSIDMAAYKVQDPDIAHALAAKSQEGVSVRLIVEKNPYQHAFNKGGGEDVQLAKLIAAGVTIHERPAHLQEKYPLGHMHVRYLIVDGKKIVLTTGNFDETTFDHCRDFAFVININPGEEGKEKFQVLQGIFNADWNNEPINIPEQLPIILGPEGQRERIAQFLKMSKKTLQIYQQFCNDEKMAEILIALKKEGVAIQLLMMAYPTGYDKEPNQVVQDRLAKAGIEVKLVDIDLLTYMHARSIIVDNELALVGTANLSPLSLDPNRELSLIIKGKTVADLAQQFSKDWSQALGLEEGRAKSLAKKVDWNQVRTK
jgi:phosphatidylserine/phosphatidylglycerophosphate/cardiolipin synthase-like enzyme